MDLTSRLIELVKNYEFLYKNDSYKGTIRKKDAWNKIGEQLNISGAKCKKKWKNLRIWYKRTKLRHRLHRVRKNCTKKDKAWKHEMQLRFLDEDQNWRTPTEHDYTQPSSLIRKQLINDSNTETATKDKLVVTEPIPFAPEILPLNTNVEIIDKIMPDSAANFSSSLAPQNNKEVKDEISVSDSVLHVTSLTSMPKKKENMDNCKSIRKGGIFHISSQQRQQTKVSCFQSSTLGQITNVAELTLPEKQQKINNCAESTTTLGNDIQNVAKYTFPQKQQNVNKRFRPGKIKKDFQMVSQPPQKLNSYVKSTTVSNIINPCFDDSDNSSADYQFSPVSYSISSLPPTPTLPLPTKINSVFGDLHEKIEHFLESATSAITDLQNDSQNSTIVLFHSLAKRIATSNLTQKQINDIESSTCALIFANLENFFLKNNPPKL